MTTRRNQFNPCKSAYVDYLPLKQSESTPYLCDNSKREEHMEMESSNCKLLDNPK